MLPYTRTLRLLALTGGSRRRIKRPLVEVYRTKSSLVSTAVHDPTRTFGIPSCGSAIDPVQRKQLAISVTSEARPHRLDKQTLVFWRDGPRVDLTTTACFVRYPSSAGGRWQIVRTGVCSWRHRSRRRMQSAAGEPRSRAPNPLQQAYCDKVCTNRLPAATHVQRTRMVRRIPRLAPWLLARALRLKVDRRPRLSILAMLGSCIVHG